jgi:hypothetical protein
MRIKRNNKISIFPPASLSTYKNNQVCWNQGFRFFFSVSASCRSMGSLIGLPPASIFYSYSYLFKLQMGFYPVAVYYNKTQHTINTHHTNNTHHSNKHSTQNYTNNKGRTTRNEWLRASPSILKAFGRAFPVSKQLRRQNSLLPHLPFLPHMRFCTNLVILVQSLSTGYITYTALDIIRVVRVWAAYISLYCQIGLFLWFFILDACAFTNGPVTVITVLLTYYI